MSTSTKKGTKPTRKDPITVALASKSMHTCSDAKKLFSQWNSLLLWSTLILLILIALGITLWLVHSSVHSGYITAYSYQSNPFVDDLQMADVPNYKENLLIFQVIRWTCMIVGNIHTYIYNLR